MFLMNTPPVVALQSKWEPFGPSGSFRLPGCLSESGEGAASAAVSAKVQMILSTLRGDEAAWGMSDGCAAQRSQKGERCREARLATHPPTLSERPTFAACMFTADLDPTEEEEATDFGPLVLDSDSDDSVDRDIEEAIQEYLKAKSGSTAQPPPGGAQPPGAAEAGSRCRPEPPYGSATPATNPAVSGGAPRGQAGASHHGSASPASVSSEDSFEQSIRAEIEQFLNEKKQHEAQKCDVSVGKTPDPGEMPAKSACRPSKEPSARAQRQDPPGAGKEFVFRKPPRVAKTSAQPRGPRSKVAAEPESSGHTKPAALEPPAACGALDAAPNKGGLRRGSGWRATRARGAAAAPEASDSSSDDGIEEAIQLYQLEKTRKEAGGELPPRAREDRGPTPHSTSNPTKSALPEPPRKAPSRKRQVLPRAAGADPGGLDTDHAPKPQKEATAPAPPTGTAARSECTERSSCRADTSAELMCAEAILDISKTILPDPVPGGDRPPPAGSLSYAPKLPSRSDGDSSSVDSDDSIEQEIRTFLALKAQSGGALPSSTESHPPSTENPLAPPGPSHQASGPKASLSKTPDASLSCRRKRRGGNTVKPSTPKKTKEGARESGQHADHHPGKALPGQGGWDLPGQGRAGEGLGREGRARGQALPAKTGRLGDEHAATDARGGVSQGHGRVDEARAVDEKESSDDKSSSLDSDEDLDTAIKDLLSSKRKLKKRCKDPKAGCKKRVRFSTTETQFLDKLGGLQKDWKDKSPQLLKSCLSKSKKDGRENAAWRPVNVFAFTGGVETERPEGAGSEEVSLAFQLRKRAAEGNWFSPDVEVRGSQSPAASPISLSDDSSVDSDDSIELEIRKFLAEKAKESMNSVETQGGGLATLGAGALAKPEMPCRKEPAPGAQPGVCTRSQRRRAAPQPAGEGLRGAERAGVQGAASIFGQGGGVPAALAKCEPAPLRSASGSAPARGPPASKKNIYSNRDQSLRGLEPAAAEKTFGQLPSCAKAAAEAESAGPFRASCRSPSVLTQSQGAEGPGPTLLGSQPPADLAVPWTDFAQQSRLPSTWVLSSEGRSPAWKGGLGSDREKGGDGQARCSPSLAMDPKKNLPFAGFSPLLSTQLFHFGKSVSWGGKQAGLFSSPLSLPLQGPSFSTFRGTPTGSSPVFGGSHLLMKKEGGRWANTKSQAGLGFPDRRTSGAAENPLDPQHGRRGLDPGEEDPEALGSDASEFSDTSVEEGGGRVVTGRVLQL
ncbi:LOW QUALITY PROTEIN: protein phosphatase 1 regulatory subunit 26 [Dasypus novemcinctus]|uniref:LOW QUALITY PROTEIN: protein phosphatase 1 regulatory subunit 26 n=1 Tax=Dasypus novemcinctus TaxID=9361 RepID=UPI0003288A7D|nr:LOW QUALITY PROTEIN: protein phosphatase 1 regulatory subunit 26 [Dasypus novemcinctus]